MLKKEPCAYFLVCLCFQTLETDATHDVRLEIRDNVLSQETLTNGKIRKGLTRTLKEDS